MNLDLNEEIVNTFEKGFELLEKNGIDKGEDDYMIVQPYKNGQAIRIKVEGQGEDRIIKTEVTNTTVILPQIDNVLNIFQED
ncbi:hypothetical protein IGK74_002424 [Enterococcus sp. AZ150]|uniref:hypothetical protein n=1 Tax=Enterococcus sp. AZ150 TaxID=2774866 RepID=UPI003F274038